MSDGGVKASHPWAEDIIRNLGLVTVGGTPRTTVGKYWGGDVPWMASGDIHLKRITDVPTRITELGLRHSNATLVNPPAVAIGLAGQGKTRGTAALVLSKLCTNQSVALVTTDATMLNVEYLFYNLEFRYDELRSRSAGGGRAGLTKTLIEQVPIPLPPLSEQAKISEVLSTLDFAIDQTRALIAKHKRIRAGLTIDLLTRGIDECGRLRTEHTHKFKDSSLGRMPVEWKSGSILDFASRTRQPILTGPFGAQLGTKDFVEEGVPVLRIGNVQAGYVDQSDLLFVSQKKAEALSRYRVQEGDLLFARQGATTGRNSLASSKEDGFLINYHIIRVAVDHTKCSPTFLYAAFNSEMVQHQVDKEKGKGTREGVNTATLQAFVLPVPPMDEQIRISAVLDGLGRHLDNTVSERNKLLSLKAALMQDLLTGKRRVTALLEPEPKRERLYA
jgi:type I restriction enzyme S subunit